MKAMTYRGYCARVEYDADDRIFVGRLTGLHDIVSFHGTNVDELETAFHESVDSYLEACAKLGQKPDKPASGKLMLRVSPEIHGAALRAANISGKSLNQWAAGVLETAAHVV